MPNYKGDDRLEKHYTPNHLISELNKLVKTYYPNPKEFLENSAGNGRIIDYLKRNWDLPIQAYDIKNEDLREDIKECNYLKEKIEYKEGRIAVINPPFNMGLKFIYKALEECDMVFSILSINSILNIDYDKYYLLEGQLWNNYQFENCKVSICLIALRKKKEGDVYE